MTSPSVCNLHHGFPRRAFPSFIDIFSIFCSLRFRFDSIPPSQQIKSIHVDNGRKSRRLLKIVADLLPDPEAASNMSQSGGISGTLRLPASDIEDLYKADLYINVATDSDQRLLRGRIMPQVRFSSRMFSFLPDHILPLSAHDGGARVGDTRTHEVRTRKKCGGPCSCRNRMGQHRLYLHAQIPGMNQLSLYCI